MRYHDGDRACGPLMTALALGRVMNVTIQVLVGDIPALHSDPKQRG